MSDRPAYHHGDLAAALLEQAIAAVRANGAHRFSLRAITRELGVDPAAAYRHYRNKTALLEAVAGHGFAQMAARMRNEMASAPTEERLRGVGRGYVLYALDEPELFRMMFGPYSQHDRDRPVDSDNPYHLLRAGLQELVQAGQCSLPVDVAADVAWSAVHGLAALAVDGPLHPDVARNRVDAVITTVLGGL